MHLVRIPIVRDLIDASLSMLIKFIVDHVDRKAEGFRFLDSTRRAILNEAQLQAMRGQRVLVLVHGIFSSLDAFNELASGDTMNRLRGVYGDNIIGWDHRTVAKTPLDNADDMLSAMPSGVQPDIICHSRGALVIRAALEHERLQAKRQTRFASVRTGLFVAGANHGSQLASFRHVNDLLNVYSAIASIPLLGSIGVALGVVVGVLKVLAHGASMLPAVKALSTDDDNTFVHDLDRPFHTSIGQLIVSRANYDPTNDVLLQALNWNVDRVFGTANDLVVTASSGIALPATAVLRVNADNTTSGDIVISNSKAGATLTIDDFAALGTTHGIGNNGGNVEITNAGSIDLPGAGGAIFTGVFATGNVALTANGVTADISTGGDHGAVFANGEQHRRPYRIRDMIASRFMILASRTLVRLA